MAYAIAWLSKWRFGRVPAIRAGLVVLLAVIALGTSLPNVSPFFKPLYGSFGICADSANRVCGSFGDSARAGIVEGDIIDFASMSMEDGYENYSERLPLVGKSVTFHVIHNGVERRVALTASYYPHQWNDRAHLMVLIAKKLCSLVLILLTMALVLMRPLRLTWALFLFAIGTTFSNPFFYSFLPAHDYIWLETLTSILECLGVVAFFLLAMLLPDNEPQGARLWGAQIAPSVFAVLTALTVWAYLRSGYFGAPVALADNAIEISWAVLYCLGIASLIGTLVRTWRVEQSASPWIAGILAVGALGPLNATITNLDPAWSHNASLFEASFLLNVVASLMLAYLIISRRVVDGQPVILRALLYGATSVCLVSLFAAFNLVFERPLAQMTVVIPFEIVIAVVLGFWLSGLADVTAALRLSEVDGPRAAAQGRRTAERDFLTQALVSAERSRNRGLIASVRARSAFSAWVNGEDAEFEHHLAQLEQVLGPASNLSLRRFLKAGQGEPMTPAGTQQTAFADLETMVSLLGCGMTNDVSAAKMYAESAITLAEQGRVAFLQVLSFVALAEFSPQERKALYGRAILVSESEGLLHLRRSAQAIDSEKLDMGMLETFVLRRLRKLRIAKPILEVSFLEGRVRSLGNNVELRDKGLGLLFVIAYNRGVAGTDDIADRLWPELDSIAARNALKACLYRLRQSLGDELAVVRVNEAYKLRDGASVDLWEIEGRMDDVRRSAILTQEQRDWLRGVRGRLCRRRPPRISKQPWFEPIERHLSELAHETGERLGKDALARGDVLEALAVGRSMVSDDPCDETAREITLRAFLLSGNNGAARREYRLYRDVLARELDVQPSAAVEALFEKNIEKATAP